MAVSHKPAGLRSQQPLGRPMPWSNCDAACKSCPEGQVVGCTGGIIQGG
jgi:hypothetical protein